VSPYGKAGESWQFCFEYFRDLEKYLAVTSGLFKTFFQVNVSSVTSGSGRHKFVYDDIRDISIAKAKHFERWRYLYRST
jgi:hypothetical protein